MNARRDTDSQEEREVRLAEVDWEGVGRLPPRVRAAVKLFIETGDLYKAAKLAGMTLDEFNELRLRLGIVRTADDM